MADSRDTLWLSVLPDMQGFGSALTKEAGKQGEKGGGVFGTRFSKAWAATAVVAGTAVAAGKQLYNIGRTFDEMSDTIAVSTGATGDALDSLVESAKTVGTQIPAEFNDVGDALATLNTLTGATGDSLEEMTNGVMEASRLLGEDASTNAEAFGKALTQWQVPAEDGTAVLDAMFVATQDYGVSLNGLMGHMNNFGPIMQNAGYEMEEAAVFFSQLEAGGIKVTRVMPALNASFRNWAAEGKDSRAEFERTVATIRDTEDATEALALASDVFGAQGAQRLTTAIRNGTLDLDDFSTALEGSEGAIKDTAAETDSFGEKWTVFKNKAMAALEPVGTAIFDGLGAGMTWISDTAMPEIQRVWNTYLKPVWDAFYKVITEDLVPALRSFWEDTLQPVLDRAKDAFDQAWDTIGPILESMREFIEDRVIPAIRALWEDHIQPTLQSAKEAFQAWWDFISPILDAVHDFIMDNLGPAFTWLLDNIIEPTWDRVVVVISGAWDVIKGIFDTIKNVLLGDFSQAWQTAKDTIATVWDTIWRTIKSVWDDHIWPIFQAVGGKLHDWLIAPFERAVEAIGNAWDKVKGFFREPINWVITNVINNGIIDLINSITGALGLSGLKISHVGTIDAPPAARVYVPRTSGTSLGGGGYAMVQARKDGGYTPPGWTLVGEEGPELVNFSAPSRVYTAQETQKALGASIDDALIPDRRYDQAEAHFALSALHSGDPDMLALAAGTSERDALLPAGGNILGRFGGWISDTWDGLTSWTADIAGKAINFARGKLADAAGLIINPLNSAIRNSSFINGVFEDTFVGLNDKILDFIRGVDEETEEIPLSEALDMEGLFADRIPMVGGSARPVRGGRLTSLFGPRWGGHHAGVDWGVPTGTPVYAWRPGVVTRAGWNALAGRTGIGMTLAHAGGMGSYYGHLSRVLASVGQSVMAGQMIGLSGNTGRSTGPHLHFEVSRGNNPHNVVNPLSYLYDQGGWLEPGMVMNATRTPEAVLDPQESQAFIALGQAAAQGGGLPSTVTLVDADGSILTRARVVAGQVYDEQERVSERYRI